MELPRGLCYKKASNTLNFVHRNVKYCPRTRKEMEYLSWVCSTLDYSTSVWDPYLKKDQTKLEMINAAVHVLWWMTTTIAAVLLPCSTHFSGHQQQLAGRTSAWFSCTRLSTDSWLCHLTNLSLLTVERDQITRTSSRPSVHQHLSTRILSFLVLYQPGTLFHTL